ncbi:MAG: rod shape-determining protein RodA [Coriobacteriales bacterium]|jgi:rod shape determining protein RodA
MTVTPQFQQSVSKPRRHSRFSLGRVNKPFMGTLAVLVIFGLIIIWAVTLSSEEYSIMRQIMGVGIGIVLMLIMWKIDYSVFAPAMIPLLVIDVILLLSPHLPIIGYSAGGATSWVNIGIRFQPGELAKVVTILLMASIVSRYQGRIDDPKEYMKCLGVLLVPFLCIMTQPDLGTGLVFLVIGFTILFIGGANRKLLIITIVVLIALIALVFLIDPVLDDLFGQDVFLKDYQKNRILVFLDDSIDPTGVGYNLQQSKIAIGSGGLFGKGIGNATQSSLGFLPEAATDFVFCTIAEQLGFVGVMFLLVLYSLLFYFSIKMAQQVTSLFGKLIIMGVCGMWLFQVLENIGMCCGLMPITGIPLPFISYGSSFMVCNFLCVGLICSVWSREKSQPKSVEGFDIK